MKSIGFVFGILGIASFGISQGCGDSGGTGGAGGSMAQGSQSSSASSSTSSSSGAGGTAGAGGTSSHPPAPAPGALIDRMGRPAVNTALNRAFEKNISQKEMAKEQWNTAEPAAWPAQQAEVEKSLAIVDSFNGVCGDQLLAGPSAAPGRYQTLAAVLTNDRLWINTDEMTCTTYLAVETNTSGDCGGRALFYDVADTTYSLLISGKTTGIGDGVNKPSDVDGAVFPYLAAPNP